MIRSGASFLEGFWAPFQGVLFLARHPGLWRYTWMPFLINVLVFTGLGILFTVAYSSLIKMLLPDGGAWYGIVLRVLLWVVGPALLLVFFAFVFVAVGNVIAGPFNDTLSQRVEIMIHGASARESIGVRAQISQIGRTILEELKRLAFFVSGSLILLLWNLVPGLGSLAYAITSGIWTLLFLALEFGDYYLGRHWTRFRQRWGKIWAHGWASLGFGCATALLLLIPFLNLVLIPGAVAGGTLFWSRLEPSPR